MIGEHNGTLYFHELRAMDSGSKCWLNMNDLGGVLYNKILTIDAL